MKIAIIGMVIIVLVGVSGFFGYSYLAKTSNTQSETQYKTESVVKIGTLQAAAGDDYTHILLSSEGTVKINSPVVDLSGYVGKKVRLVGQYSGTTLFVDSATEEP